VAVARGIRAETHHGNRLQIEKAVDVAGGHQTTLFLEAMAQPAPLTALIEPSRGVSRISDDLICLSCPVPFDVGTVNCYLLLGDPLTLIDTGSRIQFGIEDLEALMARAGVKLADLEQLVLTHRHIDHFGLAEDVKQRSGATILASRIDAPFMAAWEQNATASRADLKAYGQAFGIPDVLFDVNEKVWRGITASAHSVHTDQMLYEDEYITAGGRRLRVIECPGHTEGLITFLDERNRTWFANDHVLRHITPNPDVYSYKPEALRSGLPDYVESLHKIRDLNVDLTLPGHGYEITDLGERVDQILRHHDERSAKVLQLVGTAPSTIFSLVGEVWPELKPQAAHLAVREIIGHLVLLEHAGKVRHEVDDGVLIYRAA
jgi:glyoxylase-like metal-dependent hydrolase (beta-lactamase superfamily II)